LGWATITHPFHPLRGQRFEVLKPRQVAGTETLIVRDGERGSFSIARDWTDWGAPEPSAGLTASAGKLAFEPLMELLALIRVLQTRTLEHLDE
jgi:hypothetical protein